MSEHTPEPWTQDKYGNVSAHGFTNGQSVLVNGFGLSNTDTAQANTQRIVACVNSLAGVPDELLHDDDKNIINRYTEHLKKETVRQADLIAEVTAQRDELLAASSAVLKMWDIIYPDMKSVKYPQSAFEDIEFGEVQKLRYAIAKCEVKNG
jgi:hypothetical protein